MDGSLLEMIRFGYGADGRDPPDPAAPVDPDRLLAQLDGPDPSDAQWRRPDLAERLVLFAEAGEERKSGRAAKGGAADRLKTMFVEDAASFLLRPAATPLWFRERLVHMWANRITVAAGMGRQAYLVQSFRDNAIRPHVAGRYADMLRAALWHPAMLIYLNQDRSTGPNSPLGLRKRLGINENLAREFLELHSMGRGYTQADVTELARLLAGMETGAAGRAMNSRRTEPGPKTVLGEVFVRDGADPVAEIDRLVEMVAMRPETADHVALTVARHFLADEPAPDAVAAGAEAYLRSDGTLPAVYRALLGHRSAATRELTKIRSPQEYIAASLRAVGLSGTEREFQSRRNPRRFNLGIVAGRMGQPVYRPRQPDGWSETGQDWLTGPMMAARIDWAIDLARKVGGRLDPVALTVSVIGDLGSSVLGSAVAGAEQRWEGIAVLIGSPDFMRR